jgi:hypothetical protein
MIVEAQRHAKYAGFNVRRSGEGPFKEWFHLQPADIVRDLMRAEGDGFVAKNAGAFAAPA